MQRMSAKNNFQESVFQRPFFVLTVIKNFKYMLDIMDNIARYLNLTARCHKLGFF